jgi:hypothetical protein
MNFTALGFGVSWMSAIFGIVAIFAARAKLEFSNPYLFVNI